MSKFSKLLLSSAVKKAAVTGLANVLVASAAIGGTLAFLNHSDSDVNVMTTKNVYIEQHEYERVKDENGYKTETVDGQTSYVLQPFTQSKPLYPSAIDVGSAEWDWDPVSVRMSQVSSQGGMQMFKSASNARDKLVTVQNTGDADAYVRTIVAIEIGTVDADAIGTSYHKTWTRNKLGTVSIKGTNYLVMEYVYRGGQLSDGTWKHQKGILPAGETTYPSFSQVYLKSGATNEDCNALDGNRNGTMDILVLSQAIQSEGFENAEQALERGFGKAEADEVVGWMKDLADAAPGYKEGLLSFLFD